MGVVYRAFDPAGQRYVAIKLPLGQLSEQRLARLQREAELAARLRHPGVVGIHSVGQLPDGRAYLVYELIEGARNLCERWQEVDWRARAQDVLEVAHAVAYAHAQGVIHRDLKPENVLVDDEGRVRITDFGLGAGVDLERLTRSQVTLGTPSYMAPEAFRGATVSPSVDVWSLGVMLYQALTGELPYQAATLQALINAVHGPPPPVRERAPEVDPKVAAVCSEALRTDPEDRPENGREFALELERALRGEAPSGARRVSRVAVALAVAGLSVVGSGALVALAVARRSGAGASAQASPSAERRILAPDLLGWREPEPGQVEQLRASLSSLPPSERAHAQQELELVEALAALAAGRLQEAWDRQAQLAPEVGEVISARVRGERGEPLRAEELLPLQASADPRVAQAGRVLAARALREHDPPAAAELLASLAESPEVARERQLVEVFAALGAEDVQRLTELVARSKDQGLDLRGPRRALDRRLSEAAGAARDAEALREAVAPLAGLRAALGAGPWEPSSGVDAVFAQISELLAAKSFDPALAKALEALARAGLAPADRLRGERFADASLLLGLEQLQALRARVLVALVELGVDLEATHLFEVDEQDFQSVSAVGPARTYLAMRSRLLHAFLRLGVRRKQADPEALADARRTLARLSEEGGLAPSARARALLSSQEQNSVKQLRAACALDPQSPWLRMRLVEGLLREGQKGAATLELDQALERGQALALKERYVSLSYQVNAFYGTALHTLQEAGAEERLRALAKELQRDVIEPRAEVRNTRVAQAVRLLTRSVDAALAGKPVRWSRRKRR